MEADEKRCYVFGCVSSRKLEMLSQINGFDRHLNWTFSESSCIQFGQDVPSKFLRAELTFLEGSA